MISSLNTAVMTCPHFGVCGGCSVPGVPYEEQLARKEARVKELLAPFDLPNFPTIIPSPDTWYYRNKMEYAFGTPHLNPLPQGERKLENPSPLAGEGRVRGIALGLREAGRFNRVVDLETCLLMSPEAADLLDRARAWAKEHGLTGFDRKRQQGDLRYLVIREGKNTGERMVILIATGHSVIARSAATKQSTSDEGRLLRFARNDVQSLHDLFPNVHSFWLGLTDRRADVAQAETMQLLWGSETIEERLGSLRFRISPYSFFQTNTRGTERLYGILREWLGEGVALLDLYCGSGGISLFVANRFERVVGVDTNVSAIADAQCNAALNGIQNAEFVAEEAEKFLVRLPHSKFHVQLSAVVVDPPRPGLHPPCAQSLVALNPPVIVYVSCNPEALARDLQGFLPYYKMTRVQTVDLFPHTSHVETLVYLQHK